MRIIQWIRSAHDRKGNMMVYSLSCVGFPKEEFLKKLAYWGFGTSKSKWINTIHQITINLVTSKYSWLIHHLAMIEKLSKCSYDIL